MNNKPRILDNTLVMDFLGQYVNITEMSDEFPKIGDIFSGSVWLGTEGDKKTRSFSKPVVFDILQNVKFITTKNVAFASHYRYADSTVKFYTAICRVVSKAINDYIHSINYQERVVSPGTHQLKMQLDWPYHQDLNKTLQTGYKQASRAITEWWLPPGVSLKDTADSDRIYQLYLNLHTSKQRAYITSLTEPLSGVEAAPF